MEEEHTTGAREKTCERTIAAALSVCVCVCESLVDNVVTNLEVEQSSLSSFKSYNFPKSAEIVFVCMWKTGGGNMGV